VLGIFFDGPLKTGGFGALNFGGTSNFLLLKFEGGGPSKCFAPSKLGGGGPSKCRGLLKFGGGGPSKC
jgi:hypothetical protein